VGGDAFVADIVETFASSVGPYVTRTCGGDLDDAAKAAHSIAGAAGQLGAAHLEGLARRLERSLRKGHMVSAADAAALDAEAARTVAALRAAARPGA
jgi:HPt (histidine-containing phosphotransfer) domain-containing protein